MYICKPQRAGMRNATQDCAADFNLYRITGSFLTYELLRNKRLLSKDILRWHFIFSDGKPTPDPLYLRKGILRLLIHENIPE